MNIATTMTASFANSDRRNHVLTGRQREVLAFYQDFARRNGYAPTIREAMSGLGISSTNGVADHLVSLLRKGYIARGKNKQRSVRVLRNPDGSTPACCPMCRRDL